MKDAGTKDRSTVGIKIIVFENWFVNDAVSDPSVVQRTQNKYIINQVRLTRKVGKTTSEKPQNVLRIQYNILQADWVS